jgi:hypothetical protein
VTITVTHDSTQLTESIYAKRIRDYFQQSGYFDSTSSVTRWNGRHSLIGYATVRTTHLSVNEEEYKGHQIVVVGFHRQWQYHLDAVTNQHIVNHKDVDNSILDTEVHTSSSYVAFGYEIGNSSENTPKLHYASEFAVIKGVFETTSIKSTLNKAKKRVDLNAKLVAVRNRLIELAPERFPHGYSGTSIQDFTPFNAVVGDEVFIHAHGRLREGVIVDMTGSRFIVGYVTPSNHKELKFKTLPLSRLYKRI